MEQELDQPAVSPAQGIYATLLAETPWNAKSVIAESLGNLSANEFDPDSIANPFGAGSRYSSNSVTE